MADRAAAAQSKLIDTALAAPASGSSRHWPAADRIAGPIVLGFRTPCLVISPFSAGGYPYSGTLDSPRRCG